MNPDNDEPEGAPGAPRREPSESEAGASPPEARDEGVAEERTDEASQPDVLSANMYASGMWNEGRQATHPDAEVAEGALEGGEYVDAELEFEAAPVEDEVDENDGDDSDDDGDDDGDGDEDDDEEDDGEEADETALEDDGDDDSELEEEEEENDDAGIADDDQATEDEAEEQGDDALALEEYAAPATEEPPAGAAFAQETPEPEAGEALYEPPVAQTPRREAAPVQPRRTRTPVQADDGGLFGAAEIPMPASRRHIDKQRARDARTNLDLDLSRIKRTKRYGLFLTSLTVLFVAFVLAPVTWVGAYLFFDPPSNVLMMQRAAEGQTIRHYPVPINRMSPHIIRAVIAAEDANFCRHDGFDVEAIQDAMTANARGGRTRGASTISQQTAKNLFLWPDRSWLRKGLETYFTALVEFMWPKRRVMEAYLNAAEWGDGNFGVEAAARARFGVSAADLTPLQAARLAAVLPNPNRWRADHPGPYVRQRSAQLVGRARVVREERMAACVLNLDRAN